jgi:hypothetical protein
VFERPANISEAYGGGRNIVPGAELESPEVTAARTATMRAAIGAYRKKLGIDVAPEVAAEVEGHLEVGEAAMNAGALEEAAEAFRAATGLAALASPQGGAARLRLAVCLDTLGRSDEARELYTQLGRHPSADVKKQAARLLWGMTEATAFLKAESISFDAGIKEEYGVYLSSQVNDWDVYLRERDAAEIESLQRVAAATAFALLALPVGLLVALHATAEAHRVVIVG